MQPFIIASVLDKNFNHLYYKVLDIDTGKSYKMTIEDIKKMVYNDQEKYKNTNVYDLVMHYSKRAEEEINISIPDIVLGSGEENKGYLVLKKLKNEYRYLVACTDGNTEIVKEKDLDPNKHVNAFRNAYDDIIGLINVVIETEEHKDTEREIEIRKKYNEFILKCKMFGRDNSFEYRVTEKDVILTQYTGTSSQVIVPSFVTILGENSVCAYYNSILKGEIKSITLNDGLRVIDRYALGNTRIKEITLPKTVEFTEKDAFYNSNLYDYIGDEFSLNVYKINKLNPNTVIGDFEI